MKITRIDKGTIVASDATGIRHTITVSQQRQQVCVDGKYLWVDGIKSFHIKGLGPVNKISDNEFEIVTTGKRLTCS